MKIPYRRRSRATRPSSAVRSQPALCARILGEFIRLTRLRDSRPLEEIAPLAALTVAEWEAIEAGQAPDTWEQICLIGAALHLGRTSMSWLAKIYAGAAG